MYTINDKIFGPVRGMPDVAINGKGDYLACIQEVYRIGTNVGMDSSIIVSQMCVETANFTSSIWLNDGNPGGIGIDGDDTTTHTTTSPFQKLSGKQAAMVHMATMYIKVNGSKSKLPPDLSPAETLLPVWFKHTRVMCADANFPEVNTINDLNIHFNSTITGQTEATWAWDETYQDQIVAKAKSLFGEGTMVTYGKVPFPAHQERFVLDSESGAWDNLGQRQVKGVVWHRMEGTLNGTDGWFRRGKGVSDGLTEFGIGTVNIDGPNYDGVIYQWNDPTGKSHPGVSANRAPWASGPVNKPYGDGLAFLQDNNMDLNVVNRDEAAIEISGNYDDPVSDKARKAIVMLTAYYADQAKIPYTSFPIIPGKGYSFVRWHQEFTIGTGKVCPGSVVMNLTNQMMTEIQAYMKTYQDQPTPQPAIAYHKADPVPKQDGFDHTINGHTYYAIQKNVHIVVDKAQCRTSADPNANLTRAPLNKGQTFVTCWITEGTDGKAWWVTPHGTRIQCSDTDGYFKI